MSNEEHPEINKIVNEPINNNDTISTSIVEPNNDKIINLSINNNIFSPPITEPINNNSINPNINNIINPQNIIEPNYDNVIGPNDDNIINSNINKNIINPPNIIKPTNNNHNIVNPIKKKQKSIKIKNASINIPKDSNVAIRFLLKKKQEVETDSEEDQKSIESNKNKGRQEVDMDSEEEKDIELNDKINCINNNCIKTIIAYSKLLEDYLKTKDVICFDYSKFSDHKIIGNGGFAT
ncbi:3517_t:CDS:1, partial [Gigaspora margarita]